MVGVKKWQEGRSCKLSLIPATVQPQGGEEAHPQSSFGIRSMAKDAALEGAAVAASLGAELVLAGDAEGAAQQLRAALQIREAAEDDWEAAAGDDWEAGTPLTPAPCHTAINARGSLRMFN